MAMLLTAAGQTIFCTTAGQTIFYAAVGTGFTFVMTAFGAATVFVCMGKTNPRVERGMSGFAAGVMTAASIWSLILPAMEQTRTADIGPEWFPVTVGMLTGAGFLSGLDVFLARAHAGYGTAHRRNLLLLTAVTLHNIPEGMAVGLACGLAARQPGLTLQAMALAFGIGVQNFPEGAAVSLPLRQEGYGQLRAFRDGILSGAVEPMFGILAALAAGFAEPWMPWLMSFAAGAMVYVSVEELIPRARGGIGTWTFFIGFLLMMVLDTAFG